MGKIFLNFVTHRPSLYAPPSFVTLVTLNYGMRVGRYLTNESLKKLSLYPLQTDSLTLIVSDLTPYGFRNLLSLLSLSSLCSKSPQGEVVRLFNSNRSSLVLID